MTKDGPSSFLSPFQRFEKLAKGLFAVSKKEVQEKAAEVPHKRMRKRKEAESGR